MAQDEFSIIKRYFSDIGTVAKGTVLGIGDDAAVVAIGPGQQLVVSMDTLIAGVHFPHATDPADIAYKALAVNLSDLAAMAATPAWFLLSMTLDNNDARWLSQFAQGLKAAADSFGVQLIGGDTCRGELSISIQISGTVAKDGFVTRSNARPGDLILVSGELGNAALGLADSRGDVELPAELRNSAARALNRPRPRLELVPFLRQFATAAIDVSDGLLADLGHILDASNCGANIEQAAVPMNAWITANGAYHYGLDAGDDYEICCCIAPTDAPQVGIWNQQHPNCPLHVIGEVTVNGYYLQQGDSVIELTTRPGYRHFG